MGCCKNKGKTQILPDTFSKAAFFGSLGGKITIYLLLLISIPFLPLLGFYFIFFHKTKQKNGDIQGTA